MKDVIEIKRKEFEIVETIGDRSFKATRKGKLYFVKKYDDDAVGFEKFIDAEHRLRVSGVASPKCYLYDKKTRIVVVDYIEGINCLDALLEGQLEERIIELLFKTFWYARNDRLALEYYPHNFIFANDKLYYLPFKYDKYASNESFVQKDIRLWFFTKEFIQYAHSLGKSTNASLLKSDYETNINIALMTVKYYR